MLASGVIQLRAQATSTHLLRSRLNHPSLQALLSATALARMACQGCVFFVCFLCFAHVVFLRFYSRYVYCRYVYCRYVYCRCAYCQFGIVCVTLPPVLHRGHDVCLLLVSYFSIDFWMYFWHMFLDVGYLLDCMFAPFSIILASFFRA